MPAEYKEIKFSEPTAIYRFFENDYNSNNLGMPTLTSLSINLPVFIVNNNESFLQFSRPTYTNLVLNESINNGRTEEKLLTNLDEDFIEFSIKPIYTKEFKIKVTSFIIEKTIPLHF